MVHATRARGRSTGSGKGKLTAVVILVIIAILAIIAGIIYLTEPARSLPAVLGTITHPASRANAHRNLRGWVSLVVAVIFLGAAWFTARARGADSRLRDRLRERLRDRLPDRWRDRGRRALARELNVSAEK